MNKILLLPTTYLQQNTFTAHSSLNTVITARKHSLRRLCFYRWGGGGWVGIPACLAGHMTRQQYISRCTVDVSQLVWRQQHTGNIKCMMGYVTWYTPQMENPSLWMESPPGWRTPPDRDPPLDGEPP